VRQLWQERHQALRHSLPNMHRVIADDSAYKPSVNTPCANA
jgi:hypothetical protein